MRRCPPAWRAAGAPLLLLLTAPPPDRLTAQVTLRAAAGLRYASTLVHDSIGTPFDVRPALAPEIALSATTRLDDPWSAVVTLDVSRSELERHDQDGSTADLGGVGTLALTVGVGRRLGRRFDAEASIGGLIYLPGSDSGIFAQGTGGLTALGALGFTYAPLGGAWRKLAMRTRYDLHRFLTPTLRNEGFPSGRFVHRVALGVEWAVRGGERP
jgi:hypothetical protein